MLRARQIQKQLGLKHGTAANRLRKSIIFEFIQILNIKCYRCGKRMTLETYTIDHKIPWLHSKNPKKLFFDLKNIGFSHSKCNSAARRIPNKQWGTKEERIELQRKKWAKQKRKTYSTEKRRKKYRKHGY